MKKTKKRNKIFFKKGFTMLEMIIYMAMLGVISILMTHSFMAMTKSFGAVKLSRDVNESALVAMERISREIRSAYDINTDDSVLGSSPGRLSLISLNDMGATTTIKLYMQGADIYVEKEGLFPEPLTSSSTLATGLIFNRIIASSTSEAVKLEFEITGSAGPVNRTDKFYNTIILRGSY